jgi:hypothetical protein
MKSSNNFSFKAMRSIVFIALLSTVAGPNLRAQLIGDSLTWQYYAYGGAYNGPSSFDVTATGPDAVYGNFDTYFNIVVSSPSSITFDFTSSGVWSPSTLSLSPTIQNGIAFNLNSGSPFTNVTIDPSTNMAGFDSGDVSFTSNQIQVNWAGLPYNTSDSVTLDITQSVPEPGSVPMLLLGGLGLLTVWHTRTRRAQI